jgi:hypothetical protein
MIYLSVAHQKTIRKGYQLLDGKPMIYLSVSSSQDDKKIISIT